MIGGNPLVCDQQRAVASSETAQEEITIKEADCHTNANENSHYREISWCSEESIEYLNEMETTLNQFLCKCIYYIMFHLDLKKIG